MARSSSLPVLRGNPHATKPLVMENQTNNDTDNIFWYGSGTTGGFPAWLDQGDWQSRTMFPNCCSPTVGTARTSPPPRWAKTR